MKQIYCYKKSRFRRNNFPSKLCGMFSIALKNRTWHYIRLLNNQCSNYVYDVIRYLCTRMQHFNSRGIILYVIVRRYLCQTNSFNPILNSKTSREKEDKFIQPHETCPNFLKKYFNSREPFRKCSLIGLRLKIQYFCFLDKTSTKSHLKSSILSWRNWKRIVHEQ